MQQKKLTKYKLSKTSGIPWATLADILSGKTHMERCSAGTLVKLSKALNMTLDDVLKLTVEAPVNGKPADGAYLETGLPMDLDRAIREYLEGEKQHVLHLDCLWDEVYGSINANLWGGRISEGQAKHLRAKYLFEEE